jgi:hypothetical protein
LTRQGREKIRQFYKSNPKFLEQKPESCMMILTHASARDELGLYEKKSSLANKKIDKSADSSDS